MNYGRHEATLPRASFQDVLLPNIEMAISRVFSS